MARGGGDARLGELKLTLKARPAAPLLLDEVIEIFRPTPIVLRSNQVRSRPGALSRHRKRDAALNGQRVVERSV